MLLHDALLLPLLGLLAQALLLRLAHLLLLRLALLQLLLLPLDVQALQALLALLDGLPAGQDALVVLAAVLQVGCDGQLALLLALRLDHREKPESGTDQTIKPIGCTHVECVHWDV